MRIWKFHIAISAIILSHSIASRCETANVTLQSLKSIEAASAERHQICEQVRKRPACSANEQLLKTAVGLNVTSCRAQIESLKCAEFFHQFPQYKSQAMRCEPYEVCKLGLEETTAEGCRRFGVEIRESFLKSVKSAAHCPFNLHCMTATALSFLNPGAAAAKAAEATVKTMRADVKKFRKMACLNPETQAQFQCYLLATYGSAAAGGAAAAFKVGGTLGRMALLGKDLEEADLASIARATQSKHLPERAPSKPAVNALEEFTQKTGQKVKYVDHDGKAYIVNEKGENLFVLTYGYRSDAKGELYFNKIQASANLTIDGTKNNGFYSYMMNRMFKAHPEIRKVKTDLQFDNAAVVDKYVQQGYPIEEAIKQSPSYRVYSQNGFTRIDSSTIKVSKDSDGHIVNVLYFISHQ